jgi:histidinol-phosphate phosphatase family protein
LAESPGRPGAFLDRDGTLVHDPGFLHDPRAVRLLPGAAAAVARLNEAGYAVVTVSNQSGIARGLYQEADYHAVQQRLTELLWAERAQLVGAYYCPHLPEVSGPCDCRKPGLRLFQDAAAAHGIALDRSVWIGDRLSDVEPASRLGGRAFLVRTGEGERHVQQARVLGVPVVADVAAAVARTLRG